MGPGCHRLSKGVGRGQKKGWWYRTCLMELGSQNWWLRLGIFQSLSLLAQPLSLIKEMRKRLENSNFL